MSKTEAIINEGSAYMDQYIDTKEIDLVNYLKIVYKRKWIIVLIVLFSMLYTGINSLSQPKAYEATATFFPLNMNYSIQGDGFKVEPKLRIEDLIIAILKSRKMADRIVEQLDLKKIWNKKLASDARKSLERASRITLDSKGIIILSVRSGSPELSAKIANAYVDNLDYFNSQLDIGAQKQIVQVIDRATEPEERIPRGTIGKAMQAGLIAFAFAICLALFLEFLKKSDIGKRLKEI